MNRKQRELQFNFEFIKQGSMVSTEIRPEGQFFSVETDGVPFKSLPRSSTIFIDVGNQLTEGVIDHHHLKDGITVNGKCYKSAAGILSVYPSLLDSISDECTDITIVTHSSPDFDCFASAYLVKELLQTGKMPENYEHIVEYAELIDSGKMNVSPENIATPYTISLVIDEVMTLKLEEDPNYQELFKSKKWSDVYEMKNIAMIDRGLELIDYLVHRLEYLSATEKSISSHVILGHEHPFTKEVIEVNLDKKKYLKDLADEENCEKHKIRLPHINDDKTLVEVDGLIWNFVPRCSLHKLWARSDVNSPSGMGYTFTFIPAKNIKINQKKLALFEKGIQKHIHETSKVIISVDPFSEVSLVNLGKHLELAELEAEEDIFSDKKGLWRNNTGKRYQHEEWCKNKDPWYDGSSHDFTIVDAPGTGSLLSIKKIKEITLNYTEPKLKSNFSRIVHPFSFDHQKFEKIFKNLTESETVERVIVSADDYSKRADFFRPYIKKYLFGIDEDDSYNEISDYCREFKFLDMNITTNDLNIPGENKNYFANSRFLLNLKAAKLILFKYGVGFLVFDTELEKRKEHTDILIEDLIKVNRLLCEDKYIKAAIQNEYKDVLAKSYLNLNTCEKGLVFTSVLLDEITYFESAKEEMIYKLASNTSWKAPFDLKNSHINERSKSMFYHLNEYTSFGFSKNGSSQLIINQDIKKMTNHEKDVYINQLNTLTKTNKTVDFDIFLLVLHQRFCLMDFSKKLSKYGSNDDFRKVSKLRSIILEFIVQGWYSQITNDEVGMDKYNRWINIFETEKLHDEVLDQVSMIDDRNKALNSSVIEKISVVFFPLLALNAFIGIGFMKFEEFSSYSSNIPWIIFGSIIASGIVSYFAILHHRKVRKLFKGTRNRVNKRDIKNKDIEINKEYEAL